MKRKIKSLLLLLAMAALLVGCTQADNEFKFMQAESEQIRQADLDYLKSCMFDVSEDYEFTDIDALTILAVSQAAIWEAEELNLAISRAEAREAMAARYQEFQAAALDEHNPNYENAKWFVEEAQKMKQQVPMTDEEYLDYTAYNYRVTEAYARIKEHFEAELPPETAADIMLKIKALQEYIKGLVEKYHDELVEPDLLPLLDAMLEAM